MRVKIWGDTDEIEFKPTWLSPTKYAQLPIVGPNVDLAAYEDAKRQYEQARARLINQLSPPEPLSDEELAELQKDEVIGDPTP